MKIDLYKHKERYEKWRELAKTKGISNVSRENSDLILRYLDDMYHGLNISTASVKGGRSYIRINKLRQRTSFFSKKFKK